MTCLPHLGSTPQAAIPLAAAQEYQRITTNNEIAAAIAITTKTSQRWDCGN
jgi:hypothetical protein